MPNMLSVSGQFVNSAYVVPTAVILMPIDTIQQPQSTEIHYLVYVVANVNILFPSSSNLDLKEQNCITDQVQLN